MTKRWTFHHRVVLDGADATRAQLLGVSAVNNSHGGHLRRFVCLRTGTMGKLIKRIFLLLLLLLLYHIARKTFVFKHAFLSAESNDAILHKVSLGGLGGLHSRHRQAVQHHLAHTIRATVRAQEVLELEVWSHRQDTNSCQEPKASLNTQIENQKPQQAQPHPTKMPMDSLIKKPRSICQKPQNKQTNKKHHLLRNKKKEEDEEGKKERKKKLSENETTFSFLFVFDFSSPKKKMKKKKQ